MFIICFAYFVYAYVSICLMHFFAFYVCCVLLWFIVYCSLSLILYCSPTIVAVPFALRRLSRAGGTPLTAAGRTGLGSRTSFHPCVAELLPRSSSETAANKQANKHSKQKGKRANGRTNERTN